MNEELIPWWASRGVWGPIVTMLALLLQAKGIAPDAEVEPIVDGLLSVLAGIGAIFGWWGRVEATARIDRTRVLPNLPVKAEQ